TQRIAARNENVAHGRRVLDVLHSPVDVGLLQGALAARPDETGARAVAAIYGAKVRDQQQHSVGIAVHETGDGARAVLPERIVLLARDTIELVECRGYRPAQGLARGLTLAG